MTKLQDWLKSWFTKPGFLEIVDLPMADKIWRREKARLEKCRQ